MFVLIIPFAFLDFLSSLGNAVCHGEHRQDLHVDSNCICLRGFGRNRELEKSWAIFTNQLNTFISRTQQTGSGYTSLEVATDLWEFPSQFCLSPISGIFSVVLPSQATAQLPSSSLISKCYSLLALSSHSCKWSLSIYSSHLSFEYVCLPSVLGWYEVSEFVAVAGIQIMPEADGWCSKSQEPCLPWRYFS